MFYCLKRAGRGDRNPVPRGYLPLQGTYYQPPARLVLDFNQFPKLPLYLPLGRLFFMFTPSYVRHWRLSDSAPGIIARLALGNEGLV